METLEKYFTIIAKKPTISAIEQANFLKELRTLEGFFRKVPASKKISELLILIGTRNVTTQLFYQLLKTISTTLNSKQVINQRQIHVMALSLFVKKANKFDKNFLIDLPVSAQDFYNDFSVFFGRNTSLQTFPGLFCFFIDFLVNTKYDCGWAAEFFLPLLEVFLESFWKEQENGFKNYNSRLLVKKNTLIPSIDSSTGEVSLVV